MNGLKDKTALVTGASGGIGRATAIELASAGVRVALHGFRNVNATRETARMVKAAALVAHEPPVLLGDLSKEMAAQEVVEGARSQLGSLNILVNNAGDLVERRGLADMNAEFLDRVLGANVHSAIFCTKYAVEGMKAGATGGAIVNMGSLAAWNGGGPGSSAYALSKGAVVSLTKAMAKELAPAGIRVNCVSPGLIGNTAFHAKFTKPEAFAAATNNIPLARPGEPSEVASVIAFLASDASSFLTGETIEINGGMYLR